MGRLRSLFVLAAAVSALLPGTARATILDTGAGEAAIEGKGGTSPGLSTSPTPQTSITLSGTLAGVLETLYADQTHATAAALDCSFTGASNGNEDYALGAGSGTLTCSGPSNDVEDTGANVSVGSAFVDLLCPLTYTRVGALVAATGSCSVSVGSASADETLAAVLVIVPTTVNPTTAFLFAGGGVIAL